MSDKSVGKVWSFTPLGHGNIGFISIKIWQQERFKYVQETQWSSHHPTCPNMRWNLPLWNDKCEKFNNVSEIVLFVADSSLEWRQQYQFRNQDIGEQIMFISIENLNCCIPKLCETKLKGKANSKVQQRCSYWLCLDLCSVQKYTICSALLLC